MRSTLLPKPSLLLLAAAAALVVPAAGRGAPSEQAQPFPYDPVCAWGRIANGRGFLIRCLSQAEAASLGVPEATPAGETEPSEDETAAPSEAEDEEEPKGENEEVEGDEKEDDAQPDEDAAVIEIELGPVTADKGSLPKAVASLSKAEDRYRDCIERNGGMFRDQGELHVRFLVRGRGRAEGVTVKKRRSITEAAGKCIADVVDRRFVGYPDSEMMGATLVFKFEKTEP